MNKLTNISLLLLIIISCSSYAQITLSRQVIASAGNYTTGTNISLSSTIGEAVITTEKPSNLILTQGFQQPSRKKDGNDAVDYTIINETCPGAKNGSIRINTLVNCLGPYTVNAVFVNSLIPLQNLDSLSTGKYELTIVGATCTERVTVFVGLDNDVNCELKFYSGITPNGDGVNDTWIIDNIEMFPENTVRIFNRWGHQVFFETGYNNGDKVWDGSGNNGDLPDATYFYVAVAGENTYRGWIELTK